MEEKHVILVHKRADGALFVDGDVYLKALPTWRLIEELKNRPGVIFRANTTKEGLVGTFEHAPAMVFAVKLPIEGKTNA